MSEFQEMLKLCYDSGAKLQMMNRQNLTPLTLAAHLAKKEVSNLNLIRLMIQLYDE